MLPARYDDDDDDINIYRERETDRQTSRQTDRQRLNRGIQRWREKKKAVYVNNLCD